MVSCNKQACACVKYFLNTTKDLTHARAQQAQNNQTHLSSRCGTGVRIVYLFSI